MLERKVGSRSSLHHNSVLFILRAKQPNTMTIPLVNWCPDCAETRSDHATLCTTCGTNLTTPPRRQPPNNPSLLPTLNEVLVVQNIADQRSRQANEMGTSAGIDAADHREMVNFFRRVTDVTNQISSETEAFGTQLATAGVELEAANTELFSLLENLTQQVDSLQHHLIDTGLPAPLPGGNGHGVPQDVLDKLPRVSLTERSAILKDAILTLRSDNEENISIDVVPAEFGAIQVDLSNVRCIVRDRSTRPDANHDIKDSILVLRRGEIAFAQKARMAQQRGALGVVIVNDRASPWPYVMTDSTNRSFDITIPVVMVPQGTVLPKGEGLNASLKIQDNTDMICCVCTESFCNTTIIQLPKCNHRFHEACALTWLSSHNSCPYCRSVVYSSGGTITENNGSQEVADAFYG